MIRQDALDSLRSKVYWGLFRSLSSMGSFEKMFTVIIFLKEMFSRILNIHLVLYMSGFWIFQYSKYARVLNMLRWHRFLNMLKYVWITLEYVSIFYIVWTILFTYRTMYCFQRTYLCLKASFYLLHLVHWNYFFPSMNN